MAGRSFKPASYLTSAQPSSMGHHHQARPPFARTASASSTHSTTSDDSFIATLRSLSTSTSTEQTDGIVFGSLDSSTGTSRAASPRRCHTPGSSRGSQQFGYSLDDTPGRKRSQPIAIELPPRVRAVYTPLSARGDLPGGYFPNHETIQKQYKSHPFSKTETTSSPHSPILIESMSNQSSAFHSPADTTPKAPNLVSSGHTSVQAATSAPVTMAMPMGKYHPSNYKHVSPALSPGPTTVPGPPTSLEMPAGKKRNMQSGHERRSSDVKRKLQEYQRDMIAQARLAQSYSGGNVRGAPKPESPKIMPLGSPGPITPFELEEGAGFMIAGSRAGGGNEREMVDRMIKEEERRRLGHREGSGSPVMT